MAIKTAVSSARPNLRPNIQFLDVHTTSLSLSSSLSRPSSVRGKRNPLFHICRRFLHSSDNQRLKSFTTTCLASDGAAVNVDAKIPVSDPSLELKRKAMDVAPELRGTSIFLVGMNNSVKTKLGRLLADLLRYYYFDSDSLVVEAGGGASAARLCKETDENGFCESETEVLKQLSSMGRLVVCAGNGAVQSSTNLALLRHGISLWVDLPLEIIAKDLAEDRDQLPTFDIPASGSYSEVLTQLTSLYQEMKEGYATADATISLRSVATKLGYDNLNAVTTEDMTLEVLKEIERLTRVKKMIEEAAKPF